MVRPAWIQCGCLVVEASRMCRPNSRVTELLPELLDVSCRVVSSSGHPIVSRRQPSAQHGQKFSARGTSCPGVTQWVQLVICHAHR